MTINEANKFLECVRRGWSLARAAKEAGVSVAAVQAERKKDAYFATRWDEAFEAGTDRIEDVAVERVVNGTVEGVWYKGQLVGHERRYDNGLLAKVLASRRPEKWYKPNVIGIGELGRPSGPNVRGADVAAILREKLAGLARRGLALEGPGRDFGEPDA